MGTVEGALDSIFNPGYEGISNLDKAAIMASPAPATSARPVMQARPGALGSWMLEQAGRAPGNISRPLTAADLGVQGNITQLRGSFSVTSGRAVARIGMIEGQVQNPFQIIKNLSDTARAHGATSLRIEGTLANERLYNILRSRYGLHSSGATDFIDIPVPR